MVMKIMVESAEIKRRRETKKLEEELEEEEKIRKKE
jgi:hypothetical protein